ncbi:MAG TPA: PhoU domain-containing protein [Candidatus Methylomirabilis sp.]|nr:PhoU domain-containing protein [Candidatus Methylomirabilis sp.]
MSAADSMPPSPEEQCAHLEEQTLQACQVARLAAGIVAEGIATGVSSLLDGVRQREKELDTLDREIDQGVTSVITKVNEERARGLLACLKFMIGLERVGDLLLNCSNRAAAVASRIELQDIRDLTLMASRLEKMLADVHDAFRQRDLNRALSVLRADAEMDRLRNLVFIRHLEHHDNTPRAESFHVLFMTQSLERAGDHAKNLAEEVCHLVSGHTVRHVLRSYDKPVEQMFIDDLKRKHKA